MTKAQREKAERELLKKMIKDNLKLKDFLVSATDDKTDHSDLKSLIEPVLADTFEKIRIQGIQIGWYSHAARCVAKIKDCKTVDEAIDILNEDAKKDLGEGNE